MKQAACAFASMLFLAGFCPADWVAVPPVDFSNLKSADFADDELGLVKNLYYFHELASAVVESGPKRGFIQKKVWREPKDNQPFNARILENHVAFAYFYSTKKPWNPYYGSPAVKERLEAILSYWLTLQNADGLFAEYAPDNYSLAPTSFGARTMARTLEILADGPGIDPALHDSVKTATRKAIFALLKDRTWLEKGSGWTNQYSAAYAAAVIFDRRFRDPQLVQLANQRLREAETAHHSPAGYLYESFGPDFGYSNVHLNNLSIASPYASAEMKRLFKDDLTQYYRWLSYNMVVQPDGRTLFTNSGVNCRTSTSIYDRPARPFADLVPEAAPFLLTADEAKQQVAEHRAKLEKDWGRWPALTEGSGTYSPSAFTDVDRVRAYPDADSRQSAVTKLPYLAREKFTHVRTDPRPMQFVYVRRPAYYATFNAGKPASPRQRFGLGLVWNPQTGTVLQSQPNSADDAWGTRLPGSATVCEIDLLKPQYTLNGKPLTLPPKPTDLPAGDLSVTYPLGTAGKKTIVFSDNSIRVSVTHPGPFTEQLPLLADSDKAVTVAGDRVQVSAAAGAFEIRLKGQSSAELGKASPLGPLQLATVRMQATDRLEYELVFKSNPN